MTPLQVETIFNAYPNQNVVDMIKKDQLDLSKLKGIKDFRIKIIKDKILKSEKIANILSLFNGSGLSYLMVDKLVDHYKTPEIALDVLKKNPYRLIEISGIGFNTADEIARKMGISVYDTNRINAGIEFVIDSVQENGNTYVEKKVALDLAANLLGVSHTIIEKTMLFNDEIEIYGNTKVSTKKILKYEKNIAFYLKNLIS